MRSYTGSYKIRPVIWPIWLLCCGLLQNQAFIPLQPSSRDVLDLRRLGFSGFRFHERMNTARTFDKSDTRAYIKEAENIGPLSQAYKSRQKRQTALAVATRKEDVSLEMEQKRAIYKEALIKTAVSVGTSLAFGLCVWFLKGSEFGIQYYAGYLVEQSLSVDNLFVFVVLFEYFKVPAERQGRVLSWGIFGAMIMRALMVAAGSEALTNFKVMLLGFAAILLATSYKLLTENEDAEDVDVADNKIIQIARRLVKTTDQYDGDKFFTVVDGKKVATPLLLVLVCIELSDVVFAVDSVPAVFGVTKDPFIVYTSNIFAIIGLRSLYTILAEAVTDLPYLKPAVAIILGFVGAKLGFEYFGYEVSNAVSLGVIVTLLGGGVTASLARNRRDRDEDQAVDLRKR